MMTILKYRQKWDGLSFILTKKKQSDMTEQELSKVPFRCVCHIALEDEYVATYSDESGRLGFSVVTPRKDEFAVGKGRTHYRIDE